MLQLITMWHDVRGASYEGVRQFFPPLIKGESHRVRLASRKSSRLIKRILYESNLFKIPTSFSQTQTNSNFKIWQLKLTLQCQCCQAIIAYVPV